MTPETTTAIATTQEVEKFNYIQRLGKLLVASGYFTGVKDQAQAAVKVLAGDELGIPPIAAMMGIYIVNGKVQLGANLIASRIRFHGYDYHVIQLDEQQCVIEFRGRVNGDGKRAALGQSSFSISDAQKAGIKSETYAKYPRNMLFSRAISNGAKWYTPEIFAGIPVYAEGEITDAPETQTDSPRATEQSEQSKPEAQNLPKPEAQNLPKPELTFAERLVPWAEERRRVGDKAYYSVLAFYGYEHANEVLKIPAIKRAEIMAQLKALPDAGDAQEPEGK